MVACMSCDDDLTLSQSNKLSKLLPLSFCTIVGSPCFFNKYVCVYVFVGVGLSYVPRNMFVVIFI